MIKRVIKLIERVQNSSFLGRWPRGLGKKIKQNKS